MIWGGEWNLSYACYTTYTLGIARSLYQIYDAIYFEMKSIYPSVKYMMNIFFHKYDKIPFKKLHATFGVIILERCGTKNRPTSKLLV